MASWDEAQKILDNCSDEKQKLDIILEDIFNENNVEEDERFPLFIGKYVDEYNSNGNLHMVVDIKTAWGTQIYNPYCTNIKTSLSAITKRASHIDGDIIVFIPEAGKLTRRYDVRLEWGRIFCAQKSGTNEF